MYVVLEDVARFFTEVKAVTQDIKPTYYMFSLVLCHKKKKSIQISDGTKQPGM